MFILTTSLIATTQCPGSILSSEWEWTLLEWEQGPAVEFGADLRLEVCNRQVVSGTSVWSLTQRHNST